MEFDICINTWSSLQSEWVHSVTCKDFHPFAISFLFLHWLRATNDLPFKRKQSKLSIGHIPCDGARARHASVWLLSLGWRSLRFIRVAECVSSLFHCMWRPSVCCCRHCYLIFCLRSWNQIPVILGKKFLNLFLLNGKCIIAVRVN